MPPREMSPKATRERTPRRPKKTSLQATEETTRGRPKEGSFKDLEKLRTMVAQAGDRRGDAIYAAIEGAITEAEKLQNDIDRWEAFKADKRWVGRNHKPQCLGGDALPFALLWALNNDRRTASKAKIAVEPLYAQLELSAADIVRRIRDEGGYEKVAQASAHKRRPRETPPKIIRVEETADEIPEDLTGQMVYLQILSGKGQTYKARCVYHEPRSSD